MSAPEKFRQVIHLEPAYDRRDPNPGKNYGIHGVSLRMMLEGPRGTVQFLLYTNWNVPSARDTGASVQHLYPMPADLGHHWRTPTYEGEWCQGECEYLSGAPCYYDGSGLNAERIYDVLTVEGHEGVWRELRAYYDRVCENEDAYLTEQATP